MLLNLFVDDIEREKQEELGRDLSQVELFISTCFLSTFSFFTMGFVQYTIRKELAAPFYIGAVLFLITPFLIKWFRLYKTTYYLLPVSYIFILTLCCRLDPQMSSPLLLWFYLIPYLSLQFTGKFHGLALSFLGLGIISTSKFYGQQGNYLSLFYELINIFIPYSLITFLSSYFYKESRTNKKLSQEKKVILDESRKTKDAFWANISHEIRTPLNGILGMTHLLSESQMQDEQRELLNIIRTSSENLNLILSDIIDYSKLEMDELTTERKPFHLVEMLEQVMNLFYHMAQQKRIHLSYVVDPDVPSGILTDPNRLKQVLANLISNALKFTESGSIKVIVERFDRKETLRFSVEDTGIGISQEKKEKLFSPFTQIDSRSTRKYGGTGLGLVICAKLVELMGGRIEVESQLGHGTSFAFTISALPVKVQPSGLIFEEHNPLNNITRKIDLKILVAEDNPVNQRLIVALLKKNGYRPVVASDGLEAIEAFNNQFFNLVFMDIQMPRMDGITATKKILELYPNTPPKIVAVTANALQEDRDRCFHAGMDDFITKPINSHILKSVLQRYSNQVVEVGDIIENMEKREEKPELIIKNTGSIEYKTFDLDQLLENFENDLEVVESIYDQFKIRYAKDLDLLQTAAQNSDSFQLAAVAHSLKGSLASLYSDKGIELTKSLEMMGQENQLEHSIEIIDKLSLHCEKLSEEMDTFLHQKASA